MAVTLLERLQSLLTNLTSLLCIISSWFESVTLCGAQTVKAYSSVGRTKVLKAVLLACWKADLMFRLKKAIVEFAFSEMLFTCLLQERLLLMVTFGYFKSVFVASFWPWMK